MVVEGKREEARGVDKEVDDGGMEEMIGSACVEWAAEVYAYGAVLRYSHNSLNAKNHDSNGD